MKRIAKAALGGLVYAAFWALFIASWTAGGGQ